MEGERKHDETKLFGLRVNQQGKKKKKAGNPGGGERGKGFSPRNPRNLGENPEKRLGGNQEKNQIGTAAIL